MQYDHKAGMKQRTSSIRPRIRTGDHGKAGQTDSGRGREYNRVTRWCLHHITMQPNYNLRMDNILPCT